MSNLINHDVRVLLESVPVVKVYGGSGSVAGLGQDGSDRPAFPQQEVATHQDILDYCPHLCNAQT